mgnify:CR=1 FL=1
MVARNRYRWFGRRDSFMALQQLHAQGRLKLRVLKNLPVELLDQAFELGLRGGFGDDMLRIGNIKVFMDGALGPHTAAMFQPYAGEDNNFNGRLDAAEDVNGNGKLDRYLIPEPPRSPGLRVEFEEDPSAGGERQKTQVSFYWDRSAEESVDPVSGEQDFEGYRIYRSNPGDDRLGDVIGQARVIAQYDQPGNRTGITR